MAKLHLVMPMAGRGSRFFENGFVMPKPLIEINGRPFFYWATQSIAKFVDCADITFVVLEEHIRDHAIDREINNPSDEFVKYFARPIYPGRFNDVVMGQFRAIVKQAFVQYTNDYINERRFGRLFGLGILFKFDNPFTQQLDLIFEIHFDMFLLVIGRLETRFEGYIFKLNGNPGRLPHRAFVCIQFPVDSYTDQAVRPSRFSSFDKHIKYFIRGYIIRCAGAELLSVLHRNRGNREVFICSLSL